MLQNDAVLYRNIIAQIYSFYYFFFIFFLNLIHLYVKLSGIVLHGIQSKQKRTILSRFFTEMHDKSLCIFNNSKLQIKHQIRYFKNGQYISTISTDKAKLAVMPNNRSIYMCGKWEHDKRSPPRTKRPHGTWQTPPPLYKKTP